MLHNGITWTHLSHSFTHVAAPSPFCPTTAKRLRHVRRECNHQRRFCWKRRAESTIRMIWRAWEGCSIKRSRLCRHACEPARIAWRSPDW